MSVNEKMSSIANAIRSKTGGTNTLSLDDMAKEIQNVYDAGYSDLDLKFWEMFTANGAREIYNRAFNESDFSGYTFAKPVVPTKQIPQIFYNYRGKEYPKNIDLSKIDTSYSASSSYLAGFFQYGSNITIVPDMGLPALNGLDSTYANMRSLVTIEKIRVHENTVFKGTFVSTPNLENVTFEGVIGQNISFSGSPKLSHDSMIRIMALNLKNLIGTGETRTLTLGSTNLAKLTDAEKAMATQWGWTLA